jgi:hypothetical protein
MKKVSFSPKPWTRQQNSLLISKYPVGISPFTVSTIFDRSYYGYVPIPKDPSKHYWFCVGFCEEEKNCLNIKCFLSCSNMVSYGHGGNMTSNENTEVSEDKHFNPKIRPLSKEKNASGEAKPQFFYSTDLRRIQHFPKNKPFPEDVKKTGYMREHKGDEIEAETVKKIKEYVNTRANQTDSSNQS